MLHHNSRAGFIINLINRGNNALIARLNVPNVASTVSHNDQYPTAVRGLLRDTLDVLNVRDPEQTKVQALLREADALSTLPDEERARSEQRVIAGFMGLPGEFVQVDLPGLLGHPNLGLRTPIVYLNKTFNDADDTTPFAIPGASGNVVVAYSEYNAEHPQLDAPVTGMAVVASLYRQPRTQRCSIAISNGVWDAAHAQAIGVARRREESEAGAPRIKI